MLIALAGGQLGCAVEFDLAQLFHCFLEREALLFEVVEAFAGHAEQACGLAAAVRVGVVEVEEFADLAN